MNHTWRLLEKATVAAGETPLRMPQGVEPALQAHAQSGNVSNPSLESRSDDASRLSAMNRAFRATGGVLSCDDFVVLLREVSDQPISLLARWIVERRVVSFEARGQRWLPMFQFEPVTLVVNATTQAVIGELREIFDDWELVHWFASPNAWLRECAPADAIARDPESVLDTARGDRFVATG